MIISTEVAKEEIISIKKEEEEDNEGTRIKSRYIYLFISLLAKTNKVEKEDREDKVTMKNRRKKSINYIFS